jgi:predicted dehydrogenase
VVGVGHLGQHHARIYRALDGCDLVAIADTDPRRRWEVSTKTGARAFENPLDLIGKVDAVSIVVPTTLHRKIAEPFLDAGVHVLVEKPIAATAADARALVEHANAKKAVLQVGHIERFNPAIREASKFIQDPRYIVADRLSSFSFRSGDIGVVLDLMIHDLDIVLEILRDPIASLEAFGVPILTASEDIADARLHFQNGAIADLRASRVSTKRMRRIRVFQRSSYISLDYDSRRVSVFRRRENVESGAFDPLTVDPRALQDVQAFVFSNLIDHQVFEMDQGEDPLTAELKSFIEACRGEHPPEVPGEHGARAVEAAVLIIDTIKEYVRAEAARAGVPIPAGFARTGSVSLPDLKSEELSPTAEAEAES